MSSFMAYRITTRTSLSHFKRSEFVVTRRFSDFLGLHEKLSEKYLCRGRVIPPAPGKSIVGSTKVKMSSNSSDNHHHQQNSPVMASASAASNGSGSDQSDFTARRRYALERFINRVAAHPVLRRDYIFVEFLESVRELPRATSTSALSSASVFR
jgi:sorting nexin-1/2